MSSSLVCVRIVREKDLDRPWRDLPIACHLPSLLSGELAKDNIEKRLRYLYFSTDPTIIRVHWIYKDVEGEGHWIFPNT